MEADEQLSIVAGTLQAWLDKNVPGSSTMIASDPAHMWQQAYAATNKLRVVLCCTGEELRGEFPTAAALGRVDRHFSVLISRGRSFSAQQGQSITDRVQNAQPLFKLVAGIRDTIRCITNISAELPLDYRGFKSYPLEEGVAMDAYQIEFSAATDLPRLVARPVPDDVTEQLMGGPTS